MKLSNLSAYFMPEKSDIKYRSMYYEQRVTALQKKEIKRRFKNTVRKTTRLLWFPGVQQGYYEYEGFI